MNKEYIQKVKNRKDIIYISTTEEDKENMSSCNVKISINCGYSMEDNF